MKKCTDCQEEKPLSEFAINKTKKDGHNYRCKPCQRIYFHSYWRKNRKAQYSRIKQNKKNVFNWFKEYKKTLKCSKCGFNEHPAALDFHHVEKKERNISRWVRGCGSINGIKRELEKCIVLCANCHRIHHYSKEGQ